MEWNRNRPLGLILDEEEEEEEDIIIYDNRNNSNFITINIRELLNILLRYAVWTLSKH
jgi:hypothetical protein